MILAITGHTNIEKAVGLPLKYPNGIKYDKKAFDIVYSKIETHLKNYCSSHNIDFSSLTFVSGMARGIDEVFAILAIRNNLNLILSIPSSIQWHKNREFSRNMRAQAIYYDRILSYQKLTIFEIKKSYNNAYFVNMARNQHMVDISDGVFSFKSYNSSGTDDCIRRAKKSDKYLGNIF
jgi:predicted Rossmann fold nucleotide-binding protein DprA/Smf involved in DNA uptake